MQNSRSTYKRIGILLCRCEGKVTEKISLVKVSEWLKKDHSATIVKTSDTLCKEPNEIGGFIKHNNTTNVIVGACSKYRELFKETATKANLRPFCLKTVSLLERCALIHSTEDATEKAKITLSAAICRERKFKGVPTENLKFTMVRLDGKMDRRTFLTFPIKFRQKVIPTITTDLCVRWRGCDLCIEACPKQAFSKQGQKIQIDVSKCESCGVCTVACPNSAILFPTHSPVQIDEEMRTLVSANAGVLEPRIILFACSGGASFVDELADEGLSYPPNLMVVEIPCIGMITLFVLLRAFELGAEAVVLVPCREKCQYGYDVNRMHENVQVSAELLEVLGIGLERVCAITQSDNDLEKFRDQLKTFTENVTQLAPNPLCGKEPSELKDSWNNPLYILKQIADKLNLDRDIQVYNPKLPFCMVEVNADQCSMCGLCASRCPTDAMSLKREGEIVKLLFNYNLCTACGICLEQCPQKAMRTKRVIDLGRLEAPVSILTEDKMAKCQICGIAFLHQRQIKVVSNRLSDKPSNYFQLISKYCPNCRLKVWLKNLKEVQKLTPESEKRD